MHFSNQLLLRTSTVRRGARVARIGSEADLIVGNNVDGSVSRVVGQVGQVECLKHHALATESCISVEQDRHHLHQQHDI